MKASTRRAVGAKIARLVVQAEQKFPAPGSGPLKRAWVMKAARAETNTEGKDPSAEFGRWFGKAFLRLGIEVAVAALALAKEQLDG